MLNTPSNRYLAASALVAALAGSVLASDPQFAATVVPPLDGGTGTIGMGVNDAGWVVGQADNALGELVGFVFTNGTTTQLPLLPGGSEGQANSVNSSGLIVGQCLNADGLSRAVKWELVSGQWEITDLGTFDSQNRGMGVATRVNNAGQITGYASTEGPASYHGFIMTAGVKTDVGTLAWSGPLAFSQALGLNEAGQVSGYAYRALGGPEHGMFVGDRGGEDITPAERFGLAQWHNINNSGVMGGYLASQQLTGGAFRPATYTPGTGFTLLPLVADLPEGYGYDINDAGWMVGANFLLNPVPEPNVFVAFVYIDGVTYDLNTITEGLPGNASEARDVSNTGFIVALSDNGFAPQAVLLTPVTSCAADFNGDGFLDFFDYDDYVNCFETGTCPEGRTADFNGDDFVDFFDYDDFVSAFETGC